MSTMSCSLLVKKKHLHFLYFKSFKILTLIGNQFFCVKSLTMSTVNEPSQKDWGRVKENVCAKL